MDYNLVFHFFLRYVNGTVGMAYSQKGQHNLFFRIGRIIILFKKSGLFHVIYCLWCNSTAFGIFFLYITLNMRFEICARNCLFVIGYFNASFAYSSTSSFPLMFIWLGIQQKIKLLFF